MYTNLVKTMCASPFSFLFREVSVRSHCEKWSDGHTSVKKEHSIPEKTHSIIEKIKILSPDKPLRTSKVHVHYHDRKHQGMRET